MCLNRPKVASALSVREQLYEHEPNLWGYFVEGTPVHLTETIKSVRKLVNGSPALLDSLNVGNDADRRALADAKGWWQGWWFATSLWQGWW